MDVGGEGPDRSAAPDRVPARRAPWATGGRLAVAVTSLAVAVVVAGVALRSVGVDLGGPVAVEAGASAEGGDDLHRIEPVAVTAAIGPTSTDAPDPAAPAVPPSVDGGTGGLATDPLVGSPATPGSPTTTVASGLLPGVTVAPPVTDLTDPVVGILPAPLDTVVDSVLEPVDPLLEPVDPLLEPLDPLLGGLLSPTTTAPAGQG